MVDSSYTRSPWARTRAIWGARKIFFLLVRRDLKVRYADSVLGYVWTVLDPLLMSLVYWAVFSMLFERNVPGDDPYIVFLLAGMLPWQWFNSTVSQGAKALRSSSRLIRSTNLPREIWVLRVVASNAVEYFFALPVLAGFLIAFQVPLHWNMLITLPLAFVLMSVLLSGIGLALSVLTVLVPDLNRIVAIFLRLFFYASPVLYSTTRLPEEIRWVYVANPVADLLQLFRAGIFPQYLNWLHVGYAAAVSLLVLALGWWVFARLERTVLKEL
ncbi:ABC transporter permease [Mumia sp. zg.B53]|uniref:ABC transporter permease n=1 Tax=unclassified Mumia TaxID=2621872 RepID=UPI001C6F0D89|nr:MULTISPECIES: ABC transporter permease [unclassified Mumia]MBW9211222.1 ABC transporter permease [Mumia sp. zg.B21]MBW9215797.1 ABC transporter permease [Mumia sp. zg.B53]